MICFAVIIVSSEDDIVSFVVDGEQNTVFNNKQDAETLQRQMETLFPDERYIIVSFNIPRI